MAPRLALLSVVFGALLAGCVGRRQSTRVDPAGVAVITATSPCLVVGEEDIETVRQRCHGPRLSWEERTPAPSLRAEIVPDPLVVRTGVRARFAVRLTNTAARPVRLVLNCLPRTRVRAADGTSNLPSEHEDDGLCPTSGLGVELQPGATLRFEEEVETRRWVRMDPGPDANGWELGPDPAWEPGAALPPGPYTLEVDLLGIATGDAAFMTARGALQLE